MAIELNHTIVPSLDKEASAMFFARIFGLRYEGPAGHFAPGGGLGQRFQSLVVEQVDTHGYDRQQVHRRVCRESPVKGDKMT